MKEKMKYMEPDMEIAMLADNDVIRTSTTILDDNNGNPGSGGAGSWSDFF